MQNQVSLQAVQADECKTNEGAIFGADTASSRGIPLFPASSRIIPVLCNT